jgi:pyruvate/2-oxoglutarate dehydrogenase complex dihydrolipoamide acyltransferase (E2) component
MDALLKARAALNDVLAEKEKLAVHDLLLKAAALAMKTVPGVNARLAVVGGPCAGDAHAIARLGI